MEVDVRGQGGDLVAGLGAQGNFHRGGPEVFANAFELGHQAPTPALLIAECLAVSQGFELIEELLVADEESFTGLVAADLPRAQHRRFKIACTVAGAKMNDEIRRFIDRRCAELETSSQ